MLDGLDQPEARDLVVYPPAWYLNLVRYRLCVRVGDPRSGGGGPMLYDSHGGKATCCNEFEALRLERLHDIRILALALEMLRPHRIGDLPLHDQAFVLGLDVEEVREYLDGANEALGASPVKTLIIEDEAAVALDLKRIVRQAGHQVCGTAARHDQAVIVASTEQPQLVLADVQLGDGPEAGIAAVREIRSAGPTSVVYVTAYPERLKDDASNAFVVPKPFSAPEIQLAMWRAVYRRRHCTLAAA